MANLLDPKTKPVSNYKLLGHPYGKVVARLDALLLVLKTCKQDSCVDPWKSLHPAGNVKNLKDAMSSRYDHFYEMEMASKRVAFEGCALGQLLGQEVPIYDPTWHLKV
jgi:hypothetical protein